MLGCKGACGITPRPLKYRRSAEPPLPAPSIGDGRGDGYVRPQQQQSPAQAAEGGARDGAAEADPPGGGLAACKDGRRRQLEESMNLIALDELVDSFAGSG